MKWTIFIGIMGILGIAKTVGGISMAAPLTAEGCLNKLPPTCRCNLNVINCTATNLTTADLFLQITQWNFQRVDTIIITGNNFGELPTNRLFGESVKHHSLTMLDLSANQITKIHRETFAGMPRLEILVLNNNQIGFREEETRRGDSGVFSLLTNLKELHLKESFSELAKNVTEQVLMWRSVLQLSNLTRLQTLTLDDNGIVYLPDEMFCSFPQLTQLSLADNDMSNFRADPKCIRGLGHLDLSHNLMTVPDQNLTVLIDSAENLLSVDLSRNLFDCSCGLKPFLEWYQRSTRVVHQDDTLCDDATNDQLISVPLRDVKMSDVRCVPDGTQYLHSVYIVVGLVMVGLIAFLSCMAYANRRCICQNAKQVKMGTIGGYAQLEREAQADPEFV